MMAGESSDKELKQSTLSLYAALTQQHQSSPLTASSLVGSFSGSVLAGRDTQPASAAHRQVEMGAGQEDEAAIKINLQRSTTSRPENLRASSDL